MAADIPIHPPKYDDPSIHACGSVELTISRVACLKKRP